MRILQPLYALVVRQEQLIWNTLYTLSKFSLVETVETERLFLFVLRGSSN